ncbi:type II secretion system minor pseudopilin GspK [Enterobacter ludwigii]
MTPAPPRGMALLIVLVITAMMALVVSRMQASWPLVYERTRKTFNDQEVKWLLLGSEAAIQHQQQAVLTASVSLATQQLRLDDALVHYKVRDGQACYNLNAITASKTASVSQKLSWSQRVFFTLLRELGVEEARAKTLTWSLTDWTDPDSHTLNNDPEAQAYQHYRPPLAPANRMLLEISEIRVLNGMDRDLYQRLVPLVCTLPDKRLRININALTTEQLPLLQAMFFGELSRPQAQSFLASRPSEGWNSGDTLPPLMTISDSTRNSAMKAIVLQSDYFLLEQWLEDDRSGHQLRTLWQRREKQLTVINRQFTVE